MVTSAEKSMSCMTHPISDLQFHLPCSLEAHHQICTFRYICKVSEFSVCSMDNLEIADTIMTSLYCHICAIAKDRVRKNIQENPKLARNEHACILIFLSRTCKKIHVFCSQGNDYILGYKSYICKYPLINLT